MQAKLFLFGVKRLRSTPELDQDQDEDKNPDDDTNDNTDDDDTQAGKESQWVCLVYRWVVAQCRLNCTLYIGHRAWVNEGQDCSSECCSMQLDKPFHPMMSFGSTKRLQSDCKGSRQDSKWFNEHKCLTFCVSRNVVFLLLLPFSCYIRCTNL